MAQVAKGTIAGVKIAAVDTPFAGVTDISGVDRTADAYDSSTHDMTGIGKQYTSGLIDYGSVTFTVLYNEADLTAPATAIGHALDRMGSGNEDTFYVTEPKGHKVSFKGFVKSFKPRMPVAGLKSAALEIQVSGEITETAAA